MATSTINVNKLKVRDTLMVRIINGVTKASIHKDVKKHHNRSACRSKNWQKEY